VVGGGREAGAGWIFPGQGSQSVGMGRSLHAGRPEARAVFEEADTVLGASLSRTIFEGPDTALALTETTQPAILTASVAAARVLQTEGFSPSLVAGHSLGEYSALVTAGVLRFSDAVRLVRERGRLMQQAVPVGAGAMSAVVGLPAEAVVEACAEAARQGGVVSAANLNSPEQTVIAGDAAAVERAGGVCKGRGARKVIPLPVSAPFHCVLMAPAAAGLAPLLAEATFSDARVPVVTNVSARPETSGTALREALVAQVTAPVRWVESVRALASRGARLLEIGPGKVLCGLVRRINPEIETRAFGEAADLDEAKAFLQGGSS